jgi:hypothetical protein
MSLAALLPIPRSLTAVVALGALAACTPDTEAEFRDEVGAWLSLGETLYFNATRACTGAVFEARSGILASAMRSATSWREARLALDAGAPVAFETLTLTPSDFTGIVMDEDPTLGSQMISGGLAIRDCLDAARQSEYLTALREPDAALMFDPATRTVGVLSADRRTLFIGRGTLE